MCSEVLFSDLTWNPESNVFSFRCRCGDNIEVFIYLFIVLISVKVAFKHLEHFQVKNEELCEGYTVFPCDSCSLEIQIVNF